MIDKLATSHCSFGITFDLRDQDWTTVVNKTTAGEIVLRDLTTIYKSSSNM